VEQTLNNGVPKLVFPGPELRDFSVDRRVIILSGIAAFLGAASAVLALFLLRLIGLATNLFYYGRLFDKGHLAAAMVSPAGNHLGLWAVLVPVAGGVVVGLMARFGSDKIRGHGIPEAMEAILLRGAKVEGKVAVLKPISAAIAIGSGGPFGAEGPIIMTGGAFGSLIAQLFKLTDAERTTLLVAGAAAGMSATFAAPVSAVLLAVELLLFEWRPRSLVPVTIASAVAAAFRRVLLGSGPLFPMLPHADWVGIPALGVALLVGLVVGLGSMLLSRAVYACEDMYSKLPGHWMWWPAIGGLGVGIGGLIYPPALGVGYDLIGRLSAGDVTWHLILGIVLVKSAIWAFSLGSGTSGGVLAPLLMVGGAIGAGLAQIFSLSAPAHGVWAVVGMAAMLSGALGAPLTAAVFAFELTHDPAMLVPLLVASMAAHALTSLVMPRSIMTEKLSRRGYHLTREYTADPLEVLTVREVMQNTVVAIPENAAGAYPGLTVDGAHRQGLYPVTNAAGKVVGIFTRSDLKAIAGGAVVRPREATVVYDGETLRTVAERMAETGLTRMPVVAHENGKLAGIIGVRDVLTARSRSYQREQKRERIVSFQRRPVPRT
jgi:CIC family chloride channel protein